MTSLPGGILVGGQLKRSFSFKPVTGALELACAESVLSAATVPSGVTAVLCEALQVVGDETPTPSRVGALSVGDRQFLLSRLLGLMEDRPMWQAAHCQKCGVLFEISFRPTELPVKPAGPGYPEARVDTSLGWVNVRVPNGTDQERLAEMEGAEDVRVLLGLVTSPEGQFPEGWVEQMTEADVARVEQTVEAMSPEIATHAESDCPECGEQNQIMIDIYGCLRNPVEQLFDEVHTLATNYHWGEEEILSLPRDRRRRYLRLVERAVGVYGTGSGVAHDREGVGDGVLFRHHP